MQTGAVVMLGNSITERGRWSEFFPGTLIYNRGIGGDIIAGMQDRIEPLVASRPSKVFIMAGINNLLFFAIPVDDFRAQMRTLIASIAEASPGTQIYIQSLLPVNDGAAPEENKKYFAGKNPGIVTLNETLKALAAQMKVTFIDLYPLMLRDAKLDPAYTIDGIHLSPAGYRVWIDALAPYIR